MAWNLISHTEGYNSINTFMVVVKMHRFLVCKSVHHHTFKWINKPDATISQGYYSSFNPLNPELNPICYLLALLAHHFLHVSRIRVKPLTLRLLMSYIYMERLFLMFLDHTQRRSTVGRNPLDDFSRWAAAGRSPAEIVGSNPTGGMDICLLWVSCVVR